MAERSKALRSGRSLHWRRGFKSHSWHQSVSFTLSPASTFTHIIYGCISFLFLLYQPSITPTPFIKFTSKIYSYHIITPDFFSNLSQLERLSQKDIPPTAPKFQQDSSLQKQENQLLKEERDLLREMCNPDRSDPSRTAGGDLSHLQTVFPICKVTEVHVTRWTILWEQMKNTIGEQ